MSLKNLKFGIFAALVLLTVSERSMALPFNDDMVDIQIKTGQIMRPSVPGTVARGSLAFRLEKKEDALTLENSRKNDQNSLPNGARLFRVNCFPCHGDISAPTYNPAKSPTDVGPVAQPGKFLTPPDITRGDYLTRPDGFFYGTIHFGGAVLMPAMGWKLSVDEHWDIVNYVRKVQTDRAAAK